MRTWYRPLRGVGLAAVLVGGAALSSALAAPPARAGGSRAPSSKASFTRASDNQQTLHRKRGPFYGLRVNSMDVDGKVVVLSCFRYRCPQLDGDGRPDRYTVVRSIHVDRDVDVTDCDEILGSALGDRAVRYRAITRTTRWIRDRGPNGRTPIGGFIGRMDIDAVVKVGGGEAVLPYLDFAIVGTQGLRPRRGDPDATEETDEKSRCDAPFHDEGYYDGRFDRRGLRRLAALVAGDELAIARLRRLAQTRFVGTFEGRTFLDEDRVRDFDFCELDRVVWWMDGVAGFRCRRPPEVSDESPTDVAETPAVAR